MLELIGLDAGGERTEEDVFCEGEKGRKELGNLEVP